MLDVFPQSLALDGRRKRPICGMSSANRLQRSGRRSRLMQYTRSKAVAALVIVPVKFCLLRLLRQRGQPMLHLLGSTDRLVHQAAVYV